MLFAASEMSFVISLWIQDIIRKHDTIKMQHYYLTNTKWCFPNRIYIDILFLTFLVNDLFINQYRWFVRYDFIIGDCDDCILFDKEMITLNV